MPFGKGFWQALGISFDEGLYIGFCAASFDLFNGPARNISIGTSAHAVGKIETIDAIQVADGLLHGCNPGKIS